MIQKLGFAPLKIADFTFIYWPLDSYSADSIFRNGFRVRHSFPGEGFVGMPGEKVHAFATYESAFKCLRLAEEELQEEFLQDPEVKYDVGIQKLGKINPENQVFKKYQERTKEERDLVGRLLEGVKETPKLSENRFHFTSRSLVGDGYGVDIPELYIFELYVPTLKVQGNSVKPEENNYPAVIVEGPGFNLKRSLSGKCRRALNLAI